MNDYKATAEHSDEAERLLTPAFRRSASKSITPPATTGPKYPEIQVELTGNSANAFAILGAVRQAMRRAGVPAPEMEAFTKAATAGDYDHLLQTAIAWVDVT